MRKLHISEYKYFDGVMILFDKNHSNLYLNILRDNRENFNLMYSLRSGVFSTILLTLSVHIGLNYTHTVFLMKVFIAKHFITCEQRNYLNRIVDYKNEYLIYIQILYILIIYYACVYYAAD